jgi:uncharacterized protein YggE
MIKNLLVATTIVLMLSATAVAQFVLERPAPDRPLVTVSGQAEVMVVPDEVVFRLVVDNVNLKLSAAKSETDNDVKKVFALASTYKIAPQDVQTDYVRVSERYTEKLQNKPREFRGYSVSHTIVILLKDISRFDSLLSDIINAGISDVSDVTFRASEMRKYMDEARTLAIKAAREKAVALAGAVGQRIGKANNITEVGMSVSSAYGDDEDNSMSNSSNYSNTSAAEIGRSVADNQGTIAPGMISITVRVRASFELD